MTLGCGTALIHVNAIAARVLGRIARHIRRAHHARDAFARAVDLHDADAHADVHRAVLPFETVFANGLAQIVGHLCGTLSRTVLQQQSELIAAQPRDGVVSANAGLEEPCDLLEQTIAGLMTAGVVDELELIQIEIQQHVRGICIRARGEQCFGQAVLELAAIDEPGQCIV